MARSQNAASNVSSGEQKYLSITELNQMLNSCLEEEFPSLVFQGEISECTRAASGHLYYRVKDENSQIDAVMWRGSAKSLSFNPEPGVQVICRGRPNVYHRSGRLQIIVSKMLPAGEGALQIQFQELKAKLEKEGLFDEARKRELPFFPKVVGIVTSQSGAAIHDMMVKIRERMPGTKVILFDARVQGKGSAEEIALGIERLNKETSIEVIIVGRGGGSLEDLWAFNEERVVRAVFASRIPVISAVGHEVDVTLCDLAADKRAPTPTAAAEMVVPHRRDLEESIRQLEKRLFDLEYWFYPLVQEFEELASRLRDSAIRIVRESALRLGTAEAKLASIHPRKLIELIQSRLDTFERRLGFSASKLFSVALQKIELLTTRLTRSISPERYGELGRRVEQLERRLKQQTHQRLVAHAELLNQLSKRLLIASPQSALDRGYAIVESDEQLVRDANQVELGQSIRISLGKGQILGEVKGKKKTNRF